MLFNSRLWVLSVLAFAFSPSVLAWQDCVVGDQSPAQRFTCLSGYELDFLGDLRFELALADAAVGAEHYGYAATVLERLVLVHPEQAGARLDLVVVSLKAGDTFTAVEQLQYLYGLPNPPPLAAELLQQLALRFNPPSQGSRRLDPGVRVSVAAGYDSNPNLGVVLSEIDLLINGVPVTLQPDKSLLPDPAPYATSDIELNYPYAEDGRVYAAVSGRKYDGSSDHDSLASLVHWEYQQAAGRFITATLSDFRTRDGLYLSRIGLGGREIVGRCGCYSLGASVEFFEGSQSTSRAQRGKLSASAVKVLGPVAVSPYAHASYHRQPEAPWGDTASYTLGADARGGLWGGTYSLGVSRFASFDDTAYSPLLGDARRDLVRYQVQMSYGYELGGGFEVYVDGLYTHQESSVPFYDYHRGLAEVGIRFGL